MKLKINRVENIEGERSERSGYPYMSLKPAMKVSDALKDLGGSRSETQKSVLAHHLGEKEKSQTLVQRITSARCYGLVEGRGTYTLTDVARRYYFPTSDTERQQALLEMVSAPACFGELIKKFDGAKIPEKSILANILHREFSVPDSWKDRVAAFFVSSLEVAGVLDSQGFLRFGSAQNGGIQKPTLSLIDGQAAASIAREEVTHSPSDGSVAKALGQLLTAKTSAPWGSSTSPEGVNPHTIRHGEAIMRVETPLEFEMVHWEKLNAYVQYLKSTAKESN